MKTLRKILADATVTAVSSAVVAGTVYWAALEWVDATGPHYSPTTIVTEDSYIIFQP